MGVMRVFHRPKKVDAYGSSPEHSPSGLDEKEIGKERSYNDMPPDPDAGLSDEERKKRVSILSFLRSCGPFSPQRLCAPGIVKEEKQHLCRPHDR